VRGELGCITTEEVTMRAAEVLVRELSFEEGSRVEAGQGVDDSEICRGSRGRAG
jgi:hypothetical protein